jgi:hypothetical protein
MKIITVYEANDGRRFDNKESCERHDVLLERLIHAKDSFRNGSNLYGSLGLLNDNMDNFSEEDKVILMKITKDTGFKIEHWQCSKKPGYKIVDLNVDGEVHIFGDVGCWSGPYGNWVSIRDCIRYYKHG